MSGLFFKEISQLHNAGLQESVGCSYAECEAPVINLVKDCFFHRITYLLHHYHVEFNELPPLTYITILQG